MGELPGEVPEQAKLKAMPYLSGAEAIAEKSHMNEAYLREPNQGMTGNIKAGDSLKAVNLLPFEKAAVEGWMRRKRRRLRPK